MFDFTGDATASRQLQGRRTGHIHIMNMSHVNLLTAICFSIWSTSAARPGLCARAQSACRPSEAYTAANEKCARDVPLRQHGVENKFPDTRSALSANASQNVCKLLVTTRALRAPSRRHVQRCNGCGGGMPVVVSRTSGKARIAKLPAMLSRLTLKVFVCLGLMQVCGADSGG